MTQPGHVPSPTTPLSWLTPPHLFLGLTVVCLVLMVVGTCSMYGTSGPLPPPRKPPPPPEKLAVTSYRYKEGYYRSLVEEDARKVGLTKQDAQALWKANRYFSEFTGEQKLKIGGTLETMHLRLKAGDKKIDVGEEGRSFRTDHLVLEITNRTQSYLAYRVVTSVSGKCGSKGLLPHNAMALKPEEELSRTECLLNQSGPLVIKSVEVMEISPLAYHYVSQLDPLRLRFDPRTSSAHQPAQLDSCRFLPWRVFDIALKRGDSAWYDIVDFYSRHRCDEYTFFVGYRQLTREPLRLPVRPPKID